MIRADHLIAPLALIWAGLSLGGNLVAAPAKFQVEALTTPELLQVGRAQFAWLGLAEWALAVTMIAVLIVMRRRPIITLSLGIALFAVQQFYLQPLLQARTDLILSGATPPDSLAHIAIIIAEVAKCACLCVTGATIPAKMRGKSV